MSLFYRDRKKLKQKNDFKITYRYNKYAHASDRQRVSIKE